MKKILLRILGIIICLYILKVAAGVWIVDQRENCYAEGHQWNESTYTCTKENNNSIKSGTTSTNTNSSIETGIITTGS